MSYTFSTGASCKKLGLRRANLKILIIDDHILFAEGMKFLLGSLEESTHTLYAENYDAAVNIISETGTPDLILLDINLAGTNGLSLIEKLQKLNVWSPILVVSATNSQSSSAAALQQGASGFVSKASDSKTLLGAIKIVLQGDIYSTNYSKEAKEDKKDVATITARQHEILYLLSQGMLNKQIAYELSISANTVKAHLHQIFRELNANNRTAAVQNAQKCGLL